jgi:RNA polymerase sigma factor (sigma-70 family)
MYGTSGQDREGETMTGARVQGVLRPLRRLLGGHSQGLSDGELLELYLARGEEAAFAALVHRHAGMLLGVCRRVLGDAHAAEDVLQATFLVLARQARSIRKRQSVASWLHGVAYRLAAKARSGEARRRAHERRAGAEAHRRPPADAAWRELQQALDEELARLPDPYRLPLVHSYLEDQTHEETAARLGWPVGTVKSRLARGRELLRQALGRRGLALAAPALATALAAEGAPAAVPLALLRSAARLGTLAHAGKALPEAVSGRIVDLAEGALHGLAPGKARLALLGFLLLGLLAGGGALALQAPKGAAARGAAGPGARAAGPAGLPRVDFHGDALPDGALARLGTVRLHPGARVWSLCYSPDGKRLATGGEGHKVRVWDTATGKELHALDGKEFVRAVAFVPGKGDGLLASGSYDKVVRLWDVGTGKQVAALAQPEKVHALAASPDGRLLAVAADHQIVLWDVPGRKKLRAWPAHAGGARSLAFLPDGKGLLSGGEAAQAPFMLGPARKPDDYGLALWDVPAGRLRKKFAEHNGEAQVLGLTSDGRRWASIGLGKGGRALRVWGADLRPLRTISLRDVPERLDFAAFSPDGKVLAASGSRAIHLWDADSGKRLPSLRDKGDCLPLALAFSPDARSLASSAVLARVLLWDLARRRPRHTFPAHERGLCTVAVAPDGRTAITGGLDGTAREWDLATGKPLRLLRHAAAEDALIARARYSPDGKALALSYWGGVSLWDVARGERRRTIPAPPGKGRVISLDLSPDGGRLVWQAIDDDDLHLWDVRAGKEVRRLPQGRGGCHDLAYAPTGASIASVTKRLSLWDAETGKEIYRKPIAGHCLTFSPDGLLLAVYSDPIRIVEAATGVEVARIRRRAKHGGTWSMAFSPDGRYLALTELENVGVWDVLTGQFAHTFGGHRCWTTALAFTPDGRRLVSASEDSTAVVWDMSAVKGQRPRAPDGPSLWEGLKSADRLQAYAAFWHLRQAPRRAVPLLGKHLRPVPPVDRARVEQLLKDLDSPHFAVREKATEELRGLVDLVPKRLAAFSRSGASLEARLRLERILPKDGPTLEARRLLWALRLLEMIGTPEARDLLRRMARGEPDALVTQEAHRALERLARAPARLTSE